MNKLCTITTPSTSMASTLQDPSACMDVNGTYLCTAYNPRCFVLQKVRRRLNQSLYTSQKLVWREKFCAWFLWQTIGIMAWFLWQWQRMFQSDISRHSIMYAVSIFIKYVHHEVFIYDETENKTFLDYCVEAHKSACSILNYVHFLLLVCDSPLINEI